MLANKSLKLVQQACTCTARVAYRSLSTAPAKTLHPSESGLKPPHLLTLADLTVPQIQSLIDSAFAFKKHYKSIAIPEAGRIEGAQFERGDAASCEAAKAKTLTDKTVALMFSKRSTRTRVSSETAISLLGKSGHSPLSVLRAIRLTMRCSQADTRCSSVPETFNSVSTKACTTLAASLARWWTESLLALAIIPKLRCAQPFPSTESTSRTCLLKRDCVPLCLRQTLAKHSTVPVINALSHLYHPCQILADLQTLLEFRQPFTTDLSSLEGLTIAWVGDSNNILNEMMVTYPRMGVNLQIATPKGYDLMPEVVERANEGIKQEGGKGKIIYTNDPAEAVKNANVITTDTWSV